MQRTNGSLPQGSGFKTQIFHNNIAPFQPETTWRKRGKLHVENVLSQSQSTCSTVFKERSLNVHEIRLV
ncbi:hypothetical protein CCR75_005922 [Bremia lactucae]|uniref:Uncharacterized protein n=1 Tax=Bremia lactucae TaxID=4779 RepID=A0A976ILN1_BRELC|nr:hypothetical protein CCR75_005922 [Bremia lactucae]